MNPRRLPIVNSMDAMKLVYVVVAALALTTGIERFLTADGSLQLNFDSLTFWTFVVFLTTVVRFIHGALRHFDRTYAEERSGIDWRIFQPLIDFWGLFFQSFLFFLLALTLDRYHDFVLFYLILLFGDSIWILLINVRNLKQITDGTPKNWLLANLLVMVPMGISLGILHTKEGYFQAEGLVIFLISLVAFHTAMDYWLNWGFYFEQPPREPQIIPRQEKAHSIRTVFIAGPYIGEDYNEIDEHIRAAEKVAIQIWNDGMAAFCPHLNTAHFEVKAKVPEDNYKEFDLRILGSCDALLTMPDWKASKGAMADVEQARRLGIPVYHDLEELCRAMNSDLTA